VVLEEQQDAARRATRSQVGALRPGEERNGIGGQCGEDDVGARRAVDVGCRRRGAVRLPDGDR
jgi:hypothetical protein